MSAIWAAGYVTAGICLVVAVGSLIAVIGMAYELGVIDE